MAEQPPATRVYLPPDGGPREAGPGHVLQLVASGTARTRAAIANATGLSRPTVAQRLESLFAAGLVRESAETESSGGRPAKVLTFQASAAVVLCVDIGEARTRVAVADLVAGILAEEVVAVPVAAGPEALLRRVVATARALLDEPEVPHAPLAAVGVGLPAPVDFATGRPVGWSVMAGWDGYDVRAHLGGVFDVPVVVDNDVNLLTLAEHRTRWPDERHLFYVKAGTGIGSGIVSDGRVNRGALGAAGDIGHARLSGYGDPACRCGNAGCLEALAGGWALARDLSGDGSAGEIREARDVLTLVRRGNDDAVRRLRDAGRTLGEAVAYATSLLNPRVIVIGGMLAATGDHLIAGVREVVYQRSLPLATRELTITTTQLDHHGGVIGAAYLAADSVLDPATVDRALARSDGETRTLRWVLA
ncbi:ROK family protein [Cellulomonas sp. Sa3CUA2]|uniref:ROK family protein n=1 Tax=Cellulomonas avistercoris TaxID=2762242 RepID=A0ABR8QE23_9CELL|nr:ROK family protein [Cellulomonas avistercoris]MBD7918682.1 ROK family protein [Cellulomonas avistercoris]